MVVYCGSEYKDYYMFNCAARIKEEIGAVNAEAFEIHSLCSAGVYSLKVLKAMMLTDERLKKVLVVSSSKEGDLINYADSAIYEEQKTLIFEHGPASACGFARRLRRQGL